MNFSIINHMEVADCVGDDELEMGFGRMITCDDHGHEMGMFGFFCFECILIKEEEE